MIMAALQEEVRMPVQRGEGPVGIVICPSRELARQTYDIVVEYADALRAGACVRIWRGSLHGLRVQGARAGGMAAAPGWPMAAVATLLTRPASPAPSAAPDGAPELRTLLCIGGVDMKAQADQIRNSGIHMVVATPGRLKDMLT